MSPNTCSRVVPQFGQPTGFTSLPQDAPLSFEQDDLVDIEDGRSQFQWAAPKAWVSEGPPPDADEATADDDGAIRSASQVHYYRQRNHGGDSEPSAIVSFFSGLLCLARTNSGRMGSGAGRENSVDSVDFVSTWHKAQAQASVRPVVPALKRASDTVSIPNTPETPRQGSPYVSRGVSRRGQMSASCSESRNGRGIVYPGQRVSSSIRQMMASPAASNDLVQFLDEIGRQDSMSSLNRPCSRTVSKRSVRFY